MTRLLAAFLTVTLLGAAALWWLWRAGKEWEKDPEPYWKDPEPLAPEPVKLWTAEEWRSAVDVERVWRDPRPDWLEQRTRPLKVPA